MIAALLQVHHDIEQGHRLGASSVQLLKVPRQNVPIKLPKNSVKVTDPGILVGRTLGVAATCNWWAWHVGVAMHSLLHGSQIHPHNEFSLGGDVLEHVRLEASQQVRGQEVVEPGHLILLGKILKLLLKLLQGTRGQGVWLGHAPPCHLKGLTRILRG